MAPGENEFDTPALEDDNSSTFECREVQKFRLFGLEKNDGSLGNPVS